MLILCGWIAESMGPLHLTILDILWLEDLGVARAPIFVINSVEGYRIDVLMCWPADLSQIPNFLVTAEYVDC